MTYFLRGYLRPKPKFPKTHFSIEDALKIDPPFFTETTNRVEQPTAEATLKAESPKETEIVHDDLLILTVAAKSGFAFASYELLQAIYATGMQFGDMNLFHYYQDTGTETNLLFSLASATKSGDFDLDNIGDFSCAGLMLFLDMSKVLNVQFAFDTMLKTAEQLADDLDGELRADPKTPWSEATLQQYQNRILSATAIEPT